MKAIDRGVFVDDSPYQDSPQPIGFAATISAPHMHAYALEHLSTHLVPGARALDVGSGSGYLTLAMARMVRAHYLLHNDGVRGAVGADAPAEPRSGRRVAL